MKVRIISTKWDLDEDLKEGTVTFEVNGKRYHAFSHLQDFSAGEECDIELDCIESDCTLDEVFSRNVDQRLDLEHVQDWEYIGYGKIVSINPIVADFGGLSLELGEWSRDPKIVDSFIYYPISKLSISKAK